MLTHVSYHISMPNYYHKVYQGMPFMVMENDTRKKHAGGPVNSFVSFAYPNGKQSPPTAGHHSRPHPHSAKQHITTGRYLSEPRGNSRQYMAQAGLPQDSALDMTCQHLFQRQSIDSSPAGIESYSICIYMNILLPLYLPVHWLTSMSWTKHPPWHRLYSSFGSWEGYFWEKPQKQF